MAIYDKDIIEALSSSRILASMITPAVLISACGTLLLSTSNRMGRIFDRVNVFKAEIEAILSGKTPSHPACLEYLQGQIALQKRRAAMIQKAMAALYLSTFMFISSSLAIAFNVAYARSELTWIPTMIALTGDFFLFAASAILLYESRFNLRFVTRHIEYIEQLHSRTDQNSGRDGR